MTTSNLIGLCEHHFNAVEKIEAGGSINEEERSCANCNGQYNSNYDHCKHKPISLDKFRELKKRFPGAYLI